MSQRVWDRPVRLLHWLLVAAMAVAWASGHWQPARGFDAIHQGAGYTVCAVVALRLIWGVAGSRYARFAQFVRGPAATLRYAGSVLVGREPRYIGHNPLGAWMVLALLAVAAALGLTGFLYTTEWLWGYGWLLDLHAALAWLITVLVPVHVAGVALASWRHRENLVAAMIGGDKRDPAGDDVG